MRIGTPGTATGATTGNGERGVGNGPAATTTETVVQRSANVDTGIGRTPLPRTGTINVAVPLDGLGRRAHGDILDATKKI